MAEEAAERSAVARGEVATPHMTPSTAPRKAASTARALHVVVGADGAESTRVGGGAGDVDGEFISGW